ncbi:MAG: acnA [Holophagaceae bacterium]|nr:acnA [Holophagaceae bacterium]
MAIPHPFGNTQVPLEELGRFFSLPALAEHLGQDLSRLPVSIRLVLESVLRNCDGERITADHVKQLASWQPQAPRVDEIPFVVARVVLQDFTGVPLLVDLAAMREVAAGAGLDPRRIEPLVPVDLVVDHSVMIDHYGTKDALKQNMELEFQRNGERYAFMKWGMEAFQTFKVVPPGFGIVHQVNLEYLARGVHRDNEGVYYPDTLVGTDSHTTMINGVGVVAWGVGGIEAEAAMLGQPVYFLTPDVVGFELTGKLREGVTATDLVLTVTEILRKAKVVGKFVEFFGEGAASLTVPDRATLANMAPEYGATMGFFPVDEETIAYFKATGRKKKEIEAFEAYFKAQGLFGVPESGAIDYSQTLSLDLSTVVPSLAGPRRPQDRIEIGHMASRFAELFPQATKEAFPAGEGVEVHHGDVLIAAITSCTNTSNPGVMLAAGLVAQKAVEAGLKVAPHIKTSLAPGSRIVTEYLEEAGLLKPLAKLGFNVAAYGCTTCIGNSGELAPAINEAIAANDLVGAAVLSGNRNFEARIHPAIKANFLASPPLVVAYALAGNVTVDLLREPLGLDKKGEPVFLRDLWPKGKEIRALLKKAMKPKAFRENYAKVATKPGKLWDKVPSVASETYPWPASTYIAKPPFFEGFRLEGNPVFTPGVKAARIMALFGDSVTTDHISPAGSIKEASPAGQYLLAQGVAKVDFNSYGSRRGNHEVMMRGTFANVRIRNLMLPPKEDGSRVEGGLTLHQPTDDKLFIFDAAMRYQSEGVATVIFAGEEYGTGSSRDWAAKGTQLLGIKAVVARSFERIHRANLVGMGVLPLQFMPGDSWETLGLTGNETIDIELDPDLKPQSEAQLRITRADGSVVNAWLRLRIDTPIEVAYYRAGGILPFVLRDLLKPAP